MIANMDARRIVMIIVLTVVKLIVLIHVQAIVQVCVRNIVLSHVQGIVGVDVKGLHIHN